MFDKELILSELEKSDVINLTLTSGNTITFIFYSVFEHGITGYGMDEEGVDLQFIPLSDIETITKPTY